MIPEQFVGASGFGEPASHVNHQGVDHGNQSRRHTMLSQQSGFPQLQVDELSTYYPAHDNQLEAASFYDGSTCFPEGSAFIDERSA
jgi:hypothetical protein